MKQKCEFGGHSPLPPTSACRLSLCSDQARQDARVGCVDFVQESVCRCECGCAGARSGQHVGRGRLGGGGGHRHGVVLGCDLGIRTHGDDQAVVTDHHAAVLDHFNLAVEKQRQKTNSNQE